MSDHDICFFLCVCVDLEKLHPELSSNTHLSFFFFWCGPCEDASISA